MTLSLTRELTLDRAYTAQEDKIILEMQSQLGNRWSLIAQNLPGRTEDAVKIRWKSLMRNRRAREKERTKPSGSTRPKSSSSTARKKKAYSPGSTSAKKRTPRVSASYVTRPSVHMNQISPPRATWEDRTNSATPPAPPIPKVEAVLGARPVSLAQQRASEALGTPREEWGSASPMKSKKRPELVSKTGAPTDLLQQQQRQLLLMEKKGRLFPSSDASLLSPGHVMLTKQLEEAQERQKQQTLLESSWKAAAVLNRQTSEGRTADRQQRFDGLLEKILPVAPRENFVGGDGTLVLQSSNSSEKTY